MKKENYLIYGIIIVLIVQTVLLFILSSKYKEKFSDSDEQIEIVISRYNEDLNWIRNEPFNKYNYIVYNKGKDENFYKCDRVKNIVSLENIGREAHTYLYHIINNYDSLKDITIFLPGSNNMPHKNKRSTNLISYIENNKNTAFSCAEEIRTETVYDRFKDFQIDDYLSTTQSNSQINKDSSIEKSKIRPFGNWYKSVFGENVESKCFTVNAIFAVTKKDILQNPKTHYEKLIKELGNHHNPEVGHYFERSWETVFSPIDEPGYLN